MGTGLGAHLLVQHLGRQQEGAEGAGRGIEAALAINCPFDVGERGIEGGRKRRGERGGKRGGERGDERRGDRGSVCEGDDSLGVVGSSACSGHDSDEGKAITGGRNAAAQGSWFTAVGGDNAGGKGSDSSSSSSSSQFVKDVISLLRQHEVRCARGAGLKVECGTGK